MHAQEPQRGIQKIVLLGSPKRTKVLPKIEEGKANREVRGAQEPHPMGQIEH